MEEANAAKRLKAKVNAQKKREEAEAALVGPQSQHPEAVSAWQRGAIVRRIDRDWAQYGFSSAERDLWVRFGIPIDQAPLAAICAEVQDVPGFKLTPDRLSMRLTDGTILSALLRGTDSSRLEDKIAKALGRNLDLSSVAWRRAIYQSVVAPVKSTAETAALRRRLGKPAAVAELYDAVLSWADTHGPVSGQRFQLQYQAHRYVANPGSEPGALLRNYARCYGIVAGGPVLLELAAALRAPDNDARSYRAATVYAANARTRRLFFVDADAHSQVLERIAAHPHPPGIDATRLPSTTGVVWLDFASEPETTWEAKVLAWHIDGEMLRATLTSAGRTLLDLSSNSVKALSHRRVISIPLKGDAIVIPAHGQDVVAFLAAFLDVLEVQDLAGTDEERPADDGHLTHDMRKTPASVTVLYPRTTHALPNTSRKNLTERTHQWTVSGHWRNQWRPSTKDHTRLWIEEHRAGPEDAPLMNRDRVRVVKASQDLDELA